MREVTHKMCLDKFSCSSLHLPLHILALMSIIVCFPVGIAQLRSALCIPGPQNRLYRNLSLRLDGSSTDSTSLFVHTFVLFPIL